MTSMPSPLLTANPNSKILMAAARAVYDSCVPSLLGGTTAYSDPIFVVAKGRVYITESGDNLPDLAIHREVPNDMTGKEIQEVLEDEQAIDSTCCILAYLTFLSSTSVDEETMDSCMESMAHEGDEIQNVFEHFSYANLLADLDRDEAARVARFARASEPH